VVEDLYHKEISEASLSDPSARVVVMEDVSHVEDPDDLPDPFESPALEFEAGFIPYPEDKLRERIAELEQELESAKRFGATWKKLALNHSTLDRPNALLALIAYEKEFAVNETHDGQRQVERAIEKLANQIIEEVEAY
jgi:hypothetical protein